MYNRLSLYRLKDLSFRRAFEELEKMKQEKMIKDFSIYNTTLEQIFIQLSKLQTGQETTN